MIIADVGAKLGLARLGAAKLGVSIDDMINAPARQIRARAELYNGSALTQVFSYTDALKEFTVERVGDESKFFGYGVCQKLNVKLIDTARQLNITTANSFEVAFGVNNNYIYTLPFFKVTEAHRDELTNELSITAYDALHGAKEHTVAELELPTGELTIRDYAVACARFLGLPSNVVGVQMPAFDTKYAQGANLEGTESVRELLNAIAEATQTIYFINSNWELVFKRLDVDGPAVLTIDKERYFTLESKANRRLVAVCSATELGDNVIAKMEQAGTTQYVRDNPFWDLREDIAELVENALANVGGLTINQFDCSWRGNFLLEIGDKIALTTKDDATATAYVLNDTITYNGYLAGQTQWSYAGSESDTLDNPSNLGEALRQTYARVDKANKQIDLLVSETADTNEKMAQLQLSTDEIIARVVASTNELKESVEAKMSADEVNIAIKQELENGVEKVETATGYKFDKDGLTVSKDGSEMTTQITEDGMKVFRDNTEVLTANNKGVAATDLHARTYLIIGGNSRFEDFNNTRTACFWIGG
jgi:hypothetical protein